MARNKSLGRPAATLLVLFVMLGGMLLVVAPAAGASNQETTAEPSMVSFTLEGEFRFLPFAEMWFSVTDSDGNLVWEGPPGEQEFVLAPGTYTIAATARTDTGDFSVQMKSIEFDSREYSHVTLRVEYMMVTEGVTIAATAYLALSALGMVRRTFGRLSRTRPTSTTPGLMHIDPTDEMLGPPSTPSLLDPPYFPSFPDGEPPPLPPGEPPLDLPIDIFEPGFVDLVGVSGTKIPVPRRFEPDEPFPEPWSPEIPYFGPGVPFWEKEHCPAETPPEGPPVISHYPTLEGGGSEDKLIDEREWEQWQEEKRILGELEGWEPEDKLADDDGVTTSDADADFREWEQRQEEKRKRGFFQRLTDFIFLKWLFGRYRSDKSPPPPELEQDIELVTDFEPRVDIPNLPSIPSDFGPVVAEVTDDRKPSVELHQLNLEFDGQLVPNSDWGSVILDYTVSSITHYFNLGLNGRWPVQNIAIFSGEPPGTRGRVAMNFDLGISSGTNVEAAAVSWSLTSDILARPPPGIRPQQLHAREYVINSGIAGEKIEIARAVPLVGALLCDPRESNPVAHAGFPNEDCGLNECVPVAVRNSIGWLNKTHKLGIKDEKYSMERLKSELRWKKTGVKDSKWFQRKDSWMKRNKIPIETKRYRVSDHKTVYAKIKDKCDVELNTKTHTVAVVGIGETCDGKYILKVAHDTEQDGCNCRNSECKQEKKKKKCLRRDGPTGCVTETLHWDPDRGGHGLKGGGPWTKNLRDFVVECPIKGK